MTQEAIAKMIFRRRRQRKTNYARRLALVKGTKPRMAIRKTNKFVYIQGIMFNREGDRIIAQASSRELKKLGWNRAARNTPSAYLAGLLFGVRAKAKNSEEFILDIGFNSPVHGGICFAALKGALDAGIKIPFEQKALPPDKRIFGEHLNKETKTIVEKIKQEILKNNSAMSKEVSKNA